VSGTQEQQGGKVKYTYHLYTSGMVSDSRIVNAKSLKEVWRLAVRGYDKISHITIQGKTLKRYNRKGALIKDAPVVFKTYSRKYFAILAMFGNVGEIYEFASMDERDECFTEAQCIVSQFAASAKADPEPTVTIVSSEETNASNSGLTSKKTWSGSAASATWQDLLTRSSIAKSFGADSVDDSESEEWWLGSMDSHSEPETTTFATVKTLPTDSKEIGVNEYMLELQGHTIAVKRNPDGTFMGEGWKWRSDWLDFDTLYFDVVGGSHSADGLDWVKAMGKYVGHTHELHPCSDHYSDGEWCFAKAWLVPSNKKFVNLPVTATVKRIRMGTTSNNTTFVYAMQRYIGKTYEFKPKSNGKYAYKGWTFVPEWLDFTGGTDGNVEGS
jgi:hypothetical protein